MRIFENRKIKELNYDICEYILRYHIFDVKIHSTSLEILESLELYMLEIGIPWNRSLDSVTGVIVSQDFDLHDEKMFHICIISDREDPVAKSNIENAVAFWVHDADKETIQTLVTEPATFNLDKIPGHLQNEEIRKMFLKTFIIAETEIDIISPWMNFNVVNDSLIHLMEQALSRGVKIRIIYGLPAGAGYDYARSKRSDQVAELLSNRFSIYGDLFKISRENIHYKLVLCDERFKLEGSFNYLSFIGDYSDPDTRREGSPFGRDVDEIRYLRKVYFR